MHRLGMQTLAQPIPTIPCKCSVLCYAHETYLLTVNNYHAAAHISRHAVSLLHASLLSVYNNNNIFYISYMYLFHIISRRP